MKHPIACLLAVIAPLCSLAVEPVPSLKSLKDEYAELSKIAAAEVARIDFTTLTEETAAATGDRLRNFAFRKMLLFAEAINSGYLGVGRPQKDLKDFLGEDLSMSTNNDGSLIIGRAIFSASVPWPEGIEPVQGAGRGWAARIFVDNKGVVENVYLEDPGHGGGSKFDFRNGNMGFSEPSREWPWKQAYRSRQELVERFSAAPLFESQSNGRPVVAFSFTEGSGLLTRYIYIYRQDEDEGWWNCIQFKRARAFSTTIKQVGGKLIISGQGVPDEVVEFGDAKSP